MIQGSVFKRALRRRSGLPSIFIVLCLFLPMAISAQESRDALYGFGGAAPEAVAAYRQGWLEILEYGRWEEAERQYRLALSISPDFVIAQSVLARLSTDASERRELEVAINTVKSGVDADGRLLLDPYLSTLEFISMRERGVSIPAEQRKELAMMAASNYRAFLDKYPGEWSVRIEYIEWIHALYGPARALEIIETMSEDENIADRGFSYFPAHFHAELGLLEEAQALARIFEDRLPQTELPQAYFLGAFLAFQKSEFDTALTKVNKALDLDPLHQLADRLKVKIEAAVSAAPLAPALR